MTDRTMYVVATDRKTWGKGMTDVEALFNALRFSSNIKKINLITIMKIPEDTELWTSCGMDELGQIYHPKGCEIKQIMIDVPEWWERKFSDIYADMQDMLREDFYRAKPDKKQLQEDTL